MKKLIIFVIIVLVAGFVIIKMNKKENTTMPNNTNQNTDTTTKVSVDPVSHASMILSWGGTNLYTDPVGVNLYAGKPDANMILLTDIHADHFDVPTLKIVMKEDTVIIAPQAVLDIMPEELKAKVHLMRNGDKLNLDGYLIEAIPMYNLPESDKSYHTRGRGNGYVVEKGGTRVYISGDSSGTPEMKSLQNIDMAFVAMNLPYTMSVEDAAEAVLAFKPKKVYPYHYRTSDGFSDVVKFKALVNAKDSSIEVVQLDWYSKK